MLTLFKKWLASRKKPTDEQMAIGVIYQNLNIANNHLIAMARLMFITPEQLVREAGNIKSNGEYLLKMLEAQKGKHESKGN